MNESGHENRNVTKAHITGRDTDVTCTSCLRNLDPAERDMPVKVFMATDLLKWIDNQRRGARTTSA